MGQQSSIRVTVVCLGNICRSPLAEYLLRHRLDESLGSDHGIVIGSAGTYSGHQGEPMHKNSAHELRGRGIDPDEFRATHLTRSLVAESDLVLGAEAEHVEHAVGLDASAQSRSFSLREFAQLTALADPDQLAGTSGAQRFHALVSVADALRRSHQDAHQWAHLGVDDPYGMPQSAFRTCADEIDQAFDPVVKILGGR